MSLLVPSEGENKLLEVMMGKTAAADVTLKLFVNNHTPDDADTEASYTEMSTQGYSAKTLTKTTWGAAAQNGSNKGEIAYPAQTWTFDGTGGDTTVYGYYVVGYSGTLLWAELFSSARLVKNNGDVLTFTPKFTLSKE